MIDLHMHTVHSDGTKTPVEILKMAEEKNLKFISFTDHNTCEAYNSLSNTNVQEIYSGKIINGVELSTKVLGVPIEILGYNFDVKLLQIEIEKLYISPEERNKIELQRLFDKAVLTGIKFDPEEIHNYSCNMFASKFFHNVITQNIENKKFIDQDSWEDSNVFYRRYMSNPSTLFYVDTSDILPDISTLIDLIHKANGLVFVPHIFEYSNNSEKILEYILNNCNIDGFECFYSTFSDEQNKYLLELCKSKNLYVSGGSDYHGSFKPKVELGIGFGNLNISEEYILPWAFK